MNPTTKRPKSTGQKAGSPPVVYSFKDADGRMPIDEDGKLHWHRSKQSLHDFAVYFAAVAILTWSRQPNGQYAITAEEPTVLAKMTGGSEA